MHLHYWKSPEGNFGDDLNPWLWDTLLPELPELGDDGLVFIGMGSILNDRIPQGRVHIVFGTGAGYGTLKLRHNWAVYAVRGPKTAALFRQDNLPLGDPAILLPLLYLPPHPPHLKVAFVPHWTTASSGGWRSAASDAGLHYIDPRRPFRQVIDGIAGASLVLAESMHAAIVADAYRIPWIPVICNHYNDFKWSDWAASLEVRCDHRLVRSAHHSRGHIYSTLFKAVKRARHRILRLPSSSFKQMTIPALDICTEALAEDRLIRDFRSSELHRILTTSCPKLSSEKMLNRRQADLAAALDRFRSEWL